MHKLLVGSGDLNIALTNSLIGRVIDLDSGARIVWGQCYYHREKLQFFPFQTFTTMHAVLYTMYSYNILSAGTDMIYTSTQDLMPIFYKWVSEIRHHKMFDSYIILGIMCGQHCYVNSTLSLLSCNAVCMVQT